ncbi:MAG TPA: isoprenylcysteine carboxylmethyltransferase family protein [Trebonia sp.]|nr:isoprenylcysteine carboxylmethyltransferase family protein [Trebonia sp.]
MHVVDYVFFLGWIVFWAYWLIAALGVKRGQGQYVRFATARLAIVLIVVILLRLGVFRAHGSAADNHNLAVAGVGLALFVLGLALAVWARLYLGRNWGMPMTQKAEPELVRTGPYRHVRHPIYSGIILAMVGTAVAISFTWLIAVIALGGYFVYSAHVEERNMTRLFPDTYPEYKHSTKMLIPFVF